MASDEQAAIQRDAGGAAGLALCLFSLSFATVLFTLAIFKLLSFFIMPSLFFDLLFIGFPVGAFLGAAFFRVRLRSFLGSLWLLQAVTVLSVGAILIAKNFTYFDYLRAHLFEVEVPKLLYQMGTFTGIFIPYFAVYGLSEYIGYQYGRERLGGRMRVVYALYLFGAAAAYVFFKTALSSLGISLVLCIAFGAIAFSIAVLARGRDRVIAAIELAAVLAVVLVPLLGSEAGSSNAIERRFLDLYKGSGQQSTKQFAREGGCTMEYEKWGLYSLCEIMASPDRSTFFGFYNDFFQWEYTRGYGFDERSLGMVPLLIVEPGAKIAIIGSGGGRQVQYARKVGHHDIVAIEIEPAVFEAVRSPRYLREEFDEVYEGADVHPVRHEARGYIERTPDRYDLIYLPSVGGYPQMMMEPGNLIRTHEAYVTMIERLTDGGVLAIWYPVGLDSKAILTRQYVRTLRALGLSTVAYRNAREFLILALRERGASPRPDGGPGRDAGSSRSLPGIADLVLLFSGKDPRVPFPPAPSLIPVELEVPDDPGFTPITDDRPFLAGNVSHILSMRQVHELWAICGAVLIAGLALFVVALRRRGDPGIPRRSYWRVAGLTFLIGANFLVMEHCLVLSLFRRTFIYYDSLMLGAVGFLVLSVIGSILAAPRTRLVLSLLGIASLAALLATGGRLPVAATILLVAPAALATGMYFPALFDLAARNPLAVFALDAIGAGFGTLLSTFIPIGFGFPAFFVVAFGLFAVTAVSSVLFFRGTSAAPA